MGRRTLALLASVLGLIATPVLAEVLDDWQNPINYPARVAAVNWGGRRLDAKTSVSFGAWTIQFSNPTYVARYEGYVDPPVRVIHVGGVDRNMTMKCSNAVSGERNCYLQFWVTSNRQCEFHTFTGFGARGIGNFVNLDIPCPTSLDVAR